MARVKALRLISSLAEFARTAGDVLLSDHSIPKRGLFDESLIQTGSMFTE